MTIPYHVLVFITSIGQYEFLSTQGKILPIYSKFEQGWFKNYLHNEYQSFGSFSRMVVLPALMAWRKARTELTPMWTAGSPVAFDPRTPRPEFLSHSYRVTLKSSGMSKLAGGLYSLNNKKSMSWFFPNFN